MSIQKCDWNPIRKFSNTPVKKIVPHGSNKSYF